MGCAPSKLHNEDTVRRCKDRRRLMKEAVYARHHLAAAHADYCRSLRTTGSALVTFASGEPFSVSDHTPAVLLGTAAAATPKPPTFTPAPHHTTPSPYRSPSIHPPPPPTPMSTTSSAHFHKPAPPPLPRRKKPIKLPHILSDSSFSSSPPPNPNFFTYTAAANSNYSSTPSQASSVWNWDSFYPPPSPPDSEFFQNLKNTKKNETQIENNDSDDDHRYIANESYDKTSNFSSYSNPFARNNETKQFDDRASNLSSYSRYSDNNHVKTHMKQPPLQKTGPDSNKWESEEDEAEREEVQCSEWGDHDYSSSSDDAREDEGSLKSGSDFGTRSNFGSVKNESSNVRVNVKNSKFSSVSEKLASEDDDGKSSFSWGNGNNRQIVVRHKDLAEIVEALREYFDKASSAGEQVTEMLEADRAQLNRSFKQLRKTIYHSSGLLSNLSSTWTSKPPLAVKYRFEPSSIEQSGDSKSLCSTLERLLAWEKKLYQEVKAREAVKIEHERKLSTLQSQEYRGEDEAKLDKTKASIKRLQSLILVTSQAVSTTSVSIVGLRDQHLVPQLVELCHSFMYMWRSMQQQHRLQNEVVQQVRGLVNQVKKGQSSTSDLHHQSTIDLESAVLSWHSNFNRLVKFQRDFIRSLHAWFKLTLLPVTTDSSHRANNSKNDVFSFFDEWKLALDRVPDTVASEAINSFNNVVHSISVKQTEELKIKKRTESASKELEKRASSLRNLEKKYYSSYSMVGVGTENGEVLDTRDPLADKRVELVSCQRRVEDENVKYAKAVEVTRAMTLNNIQTGLPGVFQAMASFSALITEALEGVCTRSYAIQ